MQPSPTTLMFFDVVLSSQLSAEANAQLQGALATAGTKLAPEVTSLQLMGDSGLGVFRSPSETYEPLKRFLREWAAQKPDDSLHGIRVAVHMAPVHRSTMSDRPVGPGINATARLAAATPEDAVSLSEETYFSFRSRLQRDGIATIYAGEFDGMAVYQFSVKAFTEGRDYFVRLAPPTDILLYLASQPSELYRLTPRKFEEVIAELFADFGYDVELTKQTRDNGIDIIALRRRDTIHSAEKYLVQCKRNSPDNKVGIAVVHEILGVGAEEPHTGLIIATTSTYTQPARALASKNTVRWQLDLRDYADVKNWLFEYSLKQTGKKPGA